MQKSNNRWKKIAVGGVIGLAVLGFLVLIGDLVKLFIISAILAYLLDPLVTSLEGRGLNRLQATATLYILLSAVLGGLLFLLMPALASEFQALQTGLDIEKTMTFLDKVERLIVSWLKFLGIRNLNLSQKFGQAMVDYGNQVFSNLLSVVTLITNLVLIPLMAFFLLKDWRAIKKRLISLAPNRYFEFVLILIYKIDQQTGRYIRGQVLDAIIIGILATFALWLLEVRYFVVIGAFTGVANLIPYVGPISGAILAISVTLIETGDFIHAVYVAIAFSIVELADKALVQPNVVAKAVNLPPLLIIVVIIIGGKFFGILGMLLSVPVTGALKVSLQEGYKIFRQYRFS